MPMPNSAQVQSACQSKAFGQGIYIAMGSGLYSVGLICCVVWPKELMGSICNYSNAEQEVAADLHRIWNSTCRRSEVDQHNTRYGAATGMPSRPRPQKLQHLRFDHLGDAGTSEPVREQDVLTGIAIGGGIIILHAARPKPSVAGIFGHDNRHGQPRARG